MGQSYAFFDCKASKEAIQAELPALRRVARTPESLELSLNEVGELGAVQVDEGLLRFIDQKGIYPTFPSNYRDQMKTAKPIKMRDLKYTIQANYPGANNEQAAMELSQVMNGIYSEFGNNEPFNVAIVGQADAGGEYSFWG